MTRFKICGLRETGHAVAAADSGADFLGFNFVHGVRRRLSEERGQAVISGYRALSGDGGPKLVGLFANQTLEEVNRTVGRCGLDLAQICGDEPLDYLDGVDVPVIRQIRVRVDGPIDRTVAETLGAVSAITDRGHMALLDRHVAGALGGTGLSFDWDVARQVAERYDILLAGGLSPDNVASAIERVRPWAVDVSSGVETGGVKAPDKILAFARQVRKPARRTPHKDMSP